MGSVQIIVIAFMARLVRPAPCSSGIDRVHIARVLGILVLGNHIQLRLGNVQCASGHVLTIDTQACHDKGSVWSTKVKAQRIDEAYQVFFVFGRVRRNSSVGIALPPNESASV